MKRLLAIAATAICCMGNQAPVKAEYMSPGARQAYRQILNAKISSDYFEIGSRELDLATAAIENKDLTAGCYHMRESGAAFGHAYIASPSPELYHLVARINQSVLEAC